MPEHSNFENPVVVALLQKQLQTLEALLEKQSSSVELQRSLLQSLSSNCLDTHQEASTTAQELVPPERRSSDSSVHSSQVAVGVEEEKVPDGASSEEVNPPWNHLSGSQPALSERQFFKSICVRPSRLLHLPRDQSWYAEALFLTQSDQELKVSLELLVSRSEFAFTLLATITMPFFLNLEVPESSIATVKFVLAYFAVTVNFLGWGYCFQMATLLNDVKEAHFKAWAAAHLKAFRHVEMLMQSLINLSWLMILIHFFGTASFLFTSLPSALAYLIVVAATIVPMKMIADLLYLACVAGYSTYYAGALSSAAMPMSPGQGQETMGKFFFGRAAEGLRLGSDRILAYYAHHASGGKTTGHSPGPLLGDASSNEPIKHKRQSLYHPSSLAAKP